MSLKIGFTEKYYTLWDVQVDTVYINDKEWYNVTKYCYIQNLSFNEDEAIKKAMSLGCNDTIVDDELKGLKSSFERKIDGTDMNSYEEWEFKSGWFKGSDIRTFTKPEYLMDYDSNKYAIARLIELGYNKYDDGNWYTNEFINGLKETKRIQSEILNDGFVVGLCESNINYNKIITVSFDDCEFNIQCDFDTKEMSYQGNVYYLPTINGKGKRVKGKTIKLFINKELNHVKDFVANSFELLD